MGCGGMKIINFPTWNGLLRLNNSYDNIEWGTGKIAFKISAVPTKVAFW